MKYAVLVGLTLIVLGCSSSKAGDVPAQNDCPTGAVVCQWCEDTCTNECGYDDGLMNFCKEQCPSDNNGVSYACSHSQPFMVIGVDAGVLCQAQPDCASLGL